MSGEPALRLPFLRGRLDSARQARRPRQPRHRDRHFIVGREARECARTGVELHAGAASSSDAEPHRQRTRDTNHQILVEASDGFADFLARQCEDLVHHHL